MAACVSPIVKMLLDSLSDCLGNRKWLAVAGYAPVRPPSHSLPSPPRRTWSWVRASSTASARASAALDGRAGGRHHPAPLPRRSLQLATVARYDRAFIGPLIAIGLIFLWANDYRRIFWIVLIPGVLAVLLLAFGVKEPQRAAVSKGINPINQASL